MKPPELVFPAQRDEPEIPLDLSVHLGASGFWMVQRTRRPEKNKSN